MLPYASGVKGRKSMARIFLSLGSNIGDRRGYLEQAIELLGSGIDIASKSSYYETAPVDYLEQDSFLNIVLEGVTGLDPEKLLAFTQSIEQQMHRVKTIRYGPRNIDIDILLYDDLSIDAENLTLPHPRMLERAFVLVPLLEVAPDLEVGGVRISDLAADMTASGIRKVE